MKSTRVRKAIATVIAVLVVGTATFGVSAQAVSFSPTSISTGATGASVSSKTALSGLTDVDTPTANYTGSFVVCGWALNAAGISRVDIYAWDSKGKPHWLGSVAGSKLTARPDVLRAYPAYKTLDSGYSYTVPAGTLSQGVYTLAVAGIGKNGMVKWASKQIRVGVTTTAGPITDIDTRSANYNGSFSVSGWALNGYGIRSVDAYAWDSKGKPHYLGSVSGSNLIARADVKRAYSAFDQLNSGYNLTVNAGALSKGVYTLAVAGIGKNGAVKWATKKITIGITTNAGPVTDLDTSSGTYTGVIPVKGWALNGTGISKVDIYAWDSKGKPHYLGSVAGSRLAARPDVERAHQEYGQLDSGYSYTVAAGTLAAGNYTLAVAGIGKDGAVKWASKGITVKRQANYPGVNETKTYTDEITGITQTVHFQGVGAGYCEVAGGYADINTTAALGALHYGMATVSLTGSNGIHQGGSTAGIAKSGQDGTFTFSNLTAGTYTLQLTAHDGTVVARYHFTVDSTGNVR